MKWKILVLIFILIQVYITPLFADIHKAGTVYRWNGVFGEIALKVPPGYMQNTHFTEGYHRDFLVFPVKSEKFLDYYVDAKVLPMPAGVTNLTLYFMDTGVAYFQSENPLLAVTEIPAKINYPGIVFTRTSLLEYHDQKDGSRQLQFLGEMEKGLLLITLHGIDEKNLNKGKTGFYKVIGSIRHSIVTNSIQKN